MSADTQVLRMPGATLITRLRVYDTITPDGQRGGTPHFHFVCTEMYFVLAGSGMVELIDASGFSVVELHTHSALVFSPGTLHRLINPNSDMEILVIMQNNGLPERGDNVVCFPDDIMADDARFAGAMQAQTLADAYRRRDLGVRGFQAIKTAFEQDTAQGQAALARLYEQGSARTADLRRSWQGVLTSGPLVEAQTSLTRLEALDANQLDYLSGAQHHLIHPAEYSKPGFCGHLNRYFDPATLTVEGVVSEGAAR
jgi:mannose-6-phosphate isomerase-like protein (cupin superfamily)